MNNKDQYGMEQNLVLNGVIELECENTRQVILQIANSMNVALELIFFILKDIKNVTRTATTNVISALPRSIIVQFNNKVIRDEILKNNKINKITNKSINTNTNDEDDRTIYISEQLTARKQYLFKIARDLKRANVIRFAWAKDGNIFIRRTEQSKTIKIKTAEQLKQLQDAYSSDE